MEWILSKYFFLTQLPVMELKICSFGKNCIFDTNFPDHFLENNLNLRNTEDFWMAFASDIQGH